MMKESVHHEGKMIPSEHAPNDGDSKFIKRKLIVLKGKGR